MISNLDADLSCKPDGTFLSNQSFRKKRVRLVEGAKEGYLELEGSPDMVLEVVSESSVTKDFDKLHELYHFAGIREYWLADVRKEFTFTIFRYTSKKFTAVRASKGWFKSQVFGKTFRLEKGADEFGNPDYSLFVK